MNNRAERRKEQFRRNAQMTERATVAATCGLALIALVIALLLWGAATNAQEMRGVVVVPIEEVEAVNSKVDQLYAEHEALVLEVRGIASGFATAITLNAQGLSELQARVAALETAPPVDVEPLPPEVNIIVDSSGGGDVLTIAEALAVAIDNDVILVRGDTEDAPRSYPERLSMRNLSDASNLTIFAYPRRSVLMHGADTQGAGGGFTFQGFQIQIPQSATGSAAYAVYVQSNGASVLDNYIRGASYGIRSRHSSPWSNDVTISGNHAYECNVGIAVWGARYIVTDNEVERLCRPETGGVDADYARGFGSDQVWKRNYFHGTHENEVGNSHVDGFQSFDRNGWFLHGLTFEENVVVDFNQGVLLESEFTPDSIRDVTIRNNIFSGGFDGNGGAAGVLAKWGVSNLDIDHNLFEYMKYNGVHVRFGASASMSFNLFYSAGNNYWLSDSESSLTESTSATYSSDSPPAYTVTLPEGVPFSMWDVFTPQHRDGGAGPHE